MRRKSDKRENAQTVRTEGGAGKTDAAQRTKILHHGAALELFSPGQDEALLLPGVDEFLDLLPVNRPRPATMTHSSTDARLLAR